MVVSTVKLQIKKANELERMGTSLQDSANVPNCIIAQQEPEGCEPELGGRIDMEVG